MRTTYYSQALLYFGLLLWADFSYASTTEQLEQRIKVLEALVQQLLAERETKDTKPKKEEAVNSVAKLAPPNNQLSKQVEALSLQVEEQQLLLDETSELIDNSMQIAGYVDVEYKGSSEPGIQEEFRMHHLSLFFTRQFSNNIKFFSEIEYEDAPKFDGVNDGSGDIEEASGTIFVEAMNFDWNYNQYVNLRAGRFFSPAGIWSEDHYPPFVTTQERPMHIFKIFPQMVDGLAGYGSTYINQSISLDYTLFLGNGESSISGKKDLNSQKAVGARTILHLPFWDEFTTGVTIYNDSEDIANGRGDKSALGYHLKARYENFAVQMEYAKAELSYIDTNLDYKREGFYAQFLYNLNQWSLGYRYDTYDQNDLLPEDIKRHSIFANYHVDQNITLKGEYHLNQYNHSVKDDFGFYIFSISTYLGR